MIFQYILGELGIEALAYAQNSPFVRTQVANDVIKTSLFTEDVYEVKC